MNQYNLQFPDNGKIYFSKTPKNAAKKAFIDLQKVNKTYNQSRISIIDNNTKKEYNYIGITNKKLNDYTTLFNKRNPVQTGGTKSISDDDFFQKINEISSNINLSVSELSKILKQKYKPENDVIVLLKDGISKIDNMNNNINLITKSLTNQNHLESQESNNSDSEKSIDEITKKINFKELIDIKNTSPEEDYISNIIEPDNVKSKQKGCTIM